MKLNDKQCLYVRSMGKALRVTAIFTSDDEANAFMASNNGHGVVATFGSFVFLASMYDKGTAIARE